jgi:hypothetical protein
MISTDTLSIHPLTYIIALEGQSYETAEDLDARIECTFLKKFSRLAKGL